MGSPGPPGSFDIQNLFKTTTPSSLSSYTPPSAPYPPGPHHPSYPSSNPSYPLNSFAPSNSYSSGNAFPSIPGSYPYNAQGTPAMYHPYMHYNQDHGPRPPPYPTPPFVQPSYPPHQAPYLQPPSTYSPPQSQYSQAHPPLTSHITLSQPNPQVSIPSASVPPVQIPSPAASPPLDGAHLMALLTTQSAEASGSEDTSAVVPPSLLELPPPILSSSGPSQGPISEVSVPPPAIAPALPTAPPVNLAPTSYRLHSSKPPRGRSLKGDHVVYDVDVRLFGESQPQLEVSPITVYGSDPELVVGRQIAVNRSYICYGLRAGTIRILNINTALRVLFRGHTQRVTDMVFFSEDVHLLASASTDGRIFVRKIVEGKADDGRVEIRDQIVMAVRFVGDWESVHPRVCWHSHSQDILVVGIGKYVLTIDVNKVQAYAPPGGFTAEETIICRVYNPLDGINIVGEHNNDVTDVSVPLWSPTCLASASQDGTVRIWGDKKLNLLSAFTPHQGLSVDSVAFMSAPRRPDLTVLITAGPLNRELKLWAQTCSDGGLPSKSGDGNWQCVQTLELKSSFEERVDKAFFNQVLVVPRASLILLANAKKNAIYVVHLEFGSTAAATRMDYLAEFSVTMPILSLTATIEGVCDGDGTVQVYCVQTQAIQQYALHLSQCFLPPEETSIDISSGIDKGTLGSHTGSGGSQAFSSIDPRYSSILTDVNTSLTTISVATVSQSGGATGPGLGSAFGVPSQLEGSKSFEQSTVSSEPVVTHESKLISVTRATSVVEIPENTDSLGCDDSAVYSGISSSSSFLKRTSRSESPTKVSEDGYVLVSSSPAGSPDQCPSSGKEQLVAEPVLPEVGVLESHSATQQEEDEFEKEHEDSLLVGPASGTKPLSSQHSGSGTIHLITPSEIMSIVARSKASEVESSISPSLSASASAVDLGKEGQIEEEAGGIEADMQKSDVNIESCFAQSDKEAEFDDKIVPKFDAKGKHEAGHSSDYSSKEFTWDGNLSESAFLETGPTDEGPQIDDGELIDESQNPTNFSSEDVQEQTKELTLKVGEVGSVAALPLSTSVTKGRKNKNKTNVGSVGATGLPLPVSAHPTLPILASPGVTSEGETSATVNPASSDLSLASQIASMQESLNQLVSMQKDLQKQMTVMVAVPVAKEGKRMEGALGQRMEKLLKAHVDAMWARIQEESVKRDKLERERVQQLSTLLSNSFNKDLPAAIERVLKKELVTVAPAVAQLVSPSLEKSALKALTDTFQKALLEKVIPQLEKGVSAKLETVVTRQLQIQLQTNLKKALQESLRACLETTVIPSFERSCQAMFEQMDTTIQRGLTEHTWTAQQQFEASQTALAASLQDTLQDTMLSASSLAASLKGTLTEGQRKLVALAETAGRGPLAPSKQSNGALPDKVLSLQHVEESLDPTIELSRLVSDRKLEEAFNKALSLSDVAIVSWLCTQVDLKALFASEPLPLSQGVLLSLVQQLGCDLGKDIAKKLEWIKEGALALNPKDPVLAPHMRPLLQQLYQNLHRQGHLIAGTELATSMRLVLHVVNSLLTVCM